MGEYIGVFYLKLINPNVALIFQLFDAWQGPKQREKSRKIKLTKRYGRDLKVNN